MDVVRQAGAMPVNVALVLLASVLVPLVALAWNHVAMLIRAWRMLRTVPGPPDWLPMAYVSSAKNSISRASSTPEEFKLLALQFVIGFTRIVQSTKLALYKVYIGVWPIVFLCSAEAVEALMKSNTLLDKALLYGLMNSWLGTGLLTSPKRKWRARRKLLTPAFHFRLLDDFVPVMVEHSRAFSNRLRTLSQQQAPLDVVPLVSCCTLDVVCETAMGVSVKAQEDDDSPYVKAVKVVSGSFLSRFVSPWKWVDAFFFSNPTGWNVKRNVDYLHRFTERIIQSRKSEYLENPPVIAASEEEVGRPYGGKRLAFLDILLMSHLRDPSFTEEGIREEVDTFMFEGHDTTAMGISFTLYLLGLYKEAQDKVYQELETIFAEDVERAATVEDLKEMRYLECVIKESHRLYPPVPVMARNADEDAEILGYRIPRGCTLLAVMYSLHRDPRFFPEPEEFRPERFLPENCVGRHAYAYVPFSAGPRNCIGQRFALQEEKVVISTVLRHFRLHSPDHRDTIRLTWELVLRPVDGLRVQFLPRKSA
ncbi:cytochrome P450 4V2-like isoform X1 [Dermacentor andersoni]|uniref:cytochrome P450 4V2-like isoform X1 n=1 Tax=Dermacentor andersoni TaxID=34620 RepID=UPI003B3BC20C